MHYLGQHNFVSQPFRSWTMTYKYVCNFLELADFFKFNLWPPTPFKISYSDALGLCTIYRIQCSKCWPKGFPKPASFIKDLLGNSYPPPCVGDPSFENGPTPTPTSLPIVQPGPPPVSVSAPPAIPPARMPVGKTIASRLTLEVDGGSMDSTKRPTSLSWAVFDQSTLSACPSLSSCQTYR